jgi:formate hydrogenlyase subunit 3/multisubunit Na+/H+ antiporter MnhD subunit
VALLLLAQGAAAAACLSADVVLMIFCLQGALCSLWLSQLQVSREEAHPMFAATYLGSLLLMAAIVIMWHRTGDASTAPLPLLLVALEPSELHHLAVLFLLGVLPLLAAWPANGWLISLAGDGAGRALAPALLLPMLGMSLALRLLPGTLLLSTLPGLGSLALFFGLICLWWGAVRAALTHSLRQFAAWLSVAQAGLFLVSLGACAHPLAQPGLAQAAALQMIASLSALAAIWLAVETIGGRWGTDSIPDLSGVHTHAPLAALALLLGGLALAALPFLAGFQVQRLLLPALLQQHRIWIVLLLVLADLMLAFAVLDTLRRLLIPARAPVKPVWTSGWLTLGLLITVGVLLWTAFFPSMLTRWAGKAAFRSLSITQSSYPLTP